MVGRTHPRHQPYEQWRSYKGFSQTCSSFNRDLLPPGLRLNGPNDARENMYQLSLTNPRDALHHSERAANK